jgi:hypothetical protein
MAGRNAPQIRTRPALFSTSGNREAKGTSVPRDGTQGDLVSDVAAGRQKLATLKDDELPDNLCALKPEARMDEVNKQMNQRKELNDKLSALVAMRDKYVADQRAKAPSKASSFDRVVEDTSKAQIKR